MGRGFISNINIAPRPQHRPTCFSFRLLQNSEVGLIRFPFYRQGPRAAGRWASVSCVPQTRWFGVSGSGDSAPGQRCQMPPFLPSPQVTSSPALLPHRRPYSQATTEPALTHTPSSGRPVVSPPLPALGISPGTMTLGVPDALGTF